jgi:hypothetical protein
MRRRDRVMLLLAVIGHVELPERDVEPVLSRRSELEPTDRAGPLSD